MNPIDPTLLTIFEAEQREHIDRIRTLLARAVNDPGAAAGPVLEELFRRAHTLKGAARAVGIVRIEDVAHGMEALFARVREGGILDAAASAEVHRALDAAEDTLASVLEDTGGEGGTVPGSVAQPQPPPDTALIRVSAESVDEVLRSTAELLSAAGRERRISRQCAELSAGASDIAKTWARLRGTIGKTAGERGVALNDALDAFGSSIGAMVNDARRTAAAARDAAWSLERLASGLKQSSALIRMTPAATVFGAFRKMVRDLAAAEGKELEVRAEGLDIQGDRLVLQALKDPVMHLLRNAVSHGIRRPGERQAEGKPRAGLVLLRLEREGDRLKLTVEDDGQGLDLAAVAAAARSRGLEAAAAGPGPEGIAKLILRPGFSTAAEVTALAGRGMGLAVVEEAVRRLNGELRLGASPAGGLSVVLLAPVSMTADRVVLVSAAGHTFALANHGLERLLRLRPDEVETGDAGEFVRLDGKLVQLMRLVDLLDLDGPQAAQGPEAARRAIPAVVLRAGGQRLAVAVDALIEEREAMVRELGLSPGMCGLATGAVPLEDSAVAVMLSSAALIERGRRSGDRRPVHNVPAPAPRPGRILVVDDSITTRSLERSIFEAHGYQVRLAVDGVEALEQLEREPADLVIADVSMPRMDGFELLERMKGNERLARIPVIIVTSLEKREDQERGLGLGADAYIIKRKFDQRELLATVKQIL